MFASWLSTWLAWSSGFAFFAGDCFSAEPLFAASFVEEAVAFESAIVVPDGFASLDFVVLLDSFVADAFVPRMWYFPQHWNDYPYFLYFFRRRMSLKQGLKEKH